MLSQNQFSQLKKLLQGNIIEVECPCGVRFYTFSNKAIYHNGACRQKYFRLKQFNLIEEAVVIEERNVEPKETEHKEPQIIQFKIKNNEKLNRLIQKEKLYTNKLKNL